MTPLHTNKRATLPPEVDYVAHNKTREFAAAFLGLTVNGLEACTNRAPPDDAANCFVPRWFSPTI